MEDKASKNGNDVVLHALFSELCRLGVREFCVAAGARNTPLLVMLLESGMDLEIRHFFDERSAAFFAVGRIMTSRHPVAVVTTSGTAAGELLPAMMEAYYQGLPLVVITADRPSHYERSGAPQAVEQRGIFGVYAAARWEGKWLTHEAGSEEKNLGEAMARTTHFNVRLEEGVGASTPFVLSDFQDFAVLEKEKREELIRAWKAGGAKTFWETRGRLAVLVGGLRNEEEVSQTRELLLKLGAPVVAEVTSNLLSDGELEKLLVSGGEKALHELDPSKVLRIGSVPSWRWWRDLEDRENVHVLSVGSGFRGLARTTNIMVAPMVDLVNFKVRLDSQEAVVLEDRGAGIMRRLDELLEKFPHSEPAWVRHLSRLVPAGATVFLGNSLPIREWNLAAVKPKPGTRFFANRGANGIDGLISTGFGVGAEAEEAWIVVGDLSALYDMNAPWILPQLKNKRWRIVVINNGGGKIFSRVAWLRELPEAVQSMIENRHTLNFEHWAKQWNLEYRRFEDAAQLKDDDTPCAVWEIVPDAEQTEAFWSAWK